MKKIALLMIVMTSLLSGCVVYDPNRDGRHRGDHDGSWNRDHDRDRDGVPNRQDRRPNDPYRY